MIPGRIRLQLDVFNVLNDVLFDVIIIVLGRRCWSLVLDRACRLREWTLARLRLFLFLFGSNLFGFRFLNCLGLFFGLQVLCELFILVLEPAQHLDQKWLILVTAICASGMLLETRFLGEIRTRRLLVLHGNLW